jgi:hypothetical protein
MGWLVGLVFCCTPYVIDNAFPGYHERLQPDAAEPPQDETLPQQGQQDTQQQQAPTQKKAKPLWRGGRGHVFRNPQSDPVRPSYRCKNAFSFRFSRD